VSRFERIPAELRELETWVVWRWGEVDPKTGKPKKPPYCATNLRRHGSSTNPETWATFEQAVAVVEAGKADGIGLALAPPYVGVDLDEELLEAERDLIAFALSSYTEESVSGTGLHVILKASLNGGGRHPEGIGVFQTDRLWYCSGKHVHGLPWEIHERQAELDAVLAEYLPKPEVTQTLIDVCQPVDLDDQALLKKMFASDPGEKIRRLWDGDWSGYSSQSQADQALCNYLAFWTDRDANRMEAMFRSCGLHREEGLKKPKGIGYLARTIETAIAATPEGYQPLARNVTPTLNRSDSALLEPRGVPTDFPGEHFSCGLEDVLGAFGELLILPDPSPVKIALASIVANYAPGDVVWPLLVGPPGCGKSEIVTALREAPNVWPLSSLTPQTLLSGYERKGKDKGPPASMLLQVGAFGILAFKDLTTVLTMHREARAQIIGQLREVADGSTEKSFGNGLRLEWKGKLGLIAGVTPVIDEQHSFLAVMGERFLLYRMPEVARRDIAHRSLRRRGREEELRERIRGMVADFLRPFRDIGRLELPEHYTEPLITLVDIVTRARTGVARDYQTRDILYLPEPEAPTRLAKQIAQLMAALIAIGVDEDEAWRLAQKVGWDSVPAVRSAVIHLLSRQEGYELTRAELQEKTGLPETTIRRVEEDLVVLGLAEHRKESDSSNSRWLIKESALAAEYWDSDREPSA